MMLKRYVRNALWLLFALFVGTSFVYIYNGAAFTRYWGGDYWSAAVVIEHGMFGTMRHFYEIGETSFTMMLIRGLIMPIGLPSLQINAALTVLLWWGAAGALLWQVRCLLNIAWTKREALFLTGLFFTSFLVAIHDMETFYWFLATYFQWAFIWWMYTFALLFWVVRHEDKSIAFYSAVMGMIGFLGGGMPYNSTWVLPLMFMLALASFLLNTTWRLRLRYLALSIFIGVSFAYVLVITAPGLGETMARYERDTGRIAQIADVFNDAYLFFSSTWLINGISLLVLGLALFKPTASLPSVVPFPAMRWLRVGLVLVALLYSATQFPNLLNHTSNVGQIGGYSYAYFFGLAMSGVLAGGWALLGLIEARTRWQHAQLLRVVKTLLVLLLAGLCALFAFYLDPKLARFLGTQWWLYALFLASHYLSPFSPQRAKWLAFAAATLVLTLSAVLVLSYFRAITAPRVITTHIFIAVSALFMVLLHWRAYLRFVAHELVGRRYVLPLLVGLLLLPLMVLLARNVGEEGARLAANARLWDTRDAYVRELIADGTSISDAIRIATETHGMAQGNYDFLYQNGAFIPDEFAEVFFAQR